MERKSRIIGYDYLRIIATFMVVMIHGSVTFLGGENTSLHIVAMEIDALCLLSVPCFFMISGALLLDSNSKAPLRSLKNRLIKQGIPFIIWSVVYVLARIAMKKIPFNLDAFTSLLSEPAYYQFWFMYTLLALYLLTPALSALVQNISKTVYRYILGIWLLFCVVQPTLAQFIPALRLSEHVDLILCEGYLGYFLLGHYLKKYGREIKKKTAIGMLVGGFLITALLTWTEYAFSGDRFLGVFYSSYLTPGVVMAVCGAFILFQNEVHRSSPLVTGLSDVSIGIYYVHMLVVTALEYVGFSGSNNLLICVLKVIAAYVVSALIAFGISRIPVLRSALLGLK